MGGAGETAATGFARYARYLASLAVLALLLRARDAPPSSSPSQPKPIRETALSTPKKWPGLWAFVLSVYNEISTDRVPLVAAGVTFYAILALFPAIAAIVALYGFFTDAATIARQMAVLGAATPGPLVDVVVSEVARLTAVPQRSLGIASVIALALAFWGAHGGIKGVMEAVNIAYDTEDRRSFLRRTLIALGMAGAGILVVLALIWLAGALPALMGRLPGARWFEAAALVLRWPLLTLILAVALGLLYAFGPHRPDARYRWITPGAVLASVLLVLGSAAFAYYLRNHASYDESYGPFGAAIGLMMWQWLASIAVLIGAEANAELDRLAGDLPEKRVLVRQAPGA